MGNHGCWRIWLSLKFTGTGCTRFWYVKIKTHSYVKSYLRYLSCYKEKLETSWSTSWVMLLTPSQGKHRYFIHDPLAYFVWWPVDFSVQTTEFCFQPPSTAACCMVVYHYNFDKCDYIHSYSQMYRRKTC